MRQDSLLAPDTVPVLVPTPSERPYTYVVPDGMAVIEHIVRRELMGWV